MANQLEILHILRAAQRPVRDQALALIAHLPRSRFTSRVAGELDALTRRRLEMTGTGWVQMPLPATAGLGGQVAAVRRMERLLATTRPKVVHAYGFQAAFTALSARRRLPEPPAVICSPFGPPGLPHGSAILSSLVTLAAGWVLRSADAVTVQSDLEAETLLPLAGTAPPEMVHVPEGVLVEPLREDFEPGAKRRLVGLDPAAAIIGVMAPPDGVGMGPVLQAARLVCDMRPNVEFVSLGQGGKTPHFARIAHELGLSGSVVFLGDRADLNEIIASLNILLVPQYFPGVPSAVVHALTAGLPVVVSDSADLPDLVRGVRQKRVVPAGEVAALHDALAAFIDIVPRRAEEDLFDSELGFSYRELLIPETAVDLDTLGLDAVSSAETSQEQKAVQRVIERYSMSRVATRFADLYMQTAAAVARS